MIDAINKPAQHGKISYQFLPKLSNGRQQWVVQYWLTNAVFCTVHQGRWDDYAYKFKFHADDAPPIELLAHITKVFVRTQHPKRREIGQ